MTQEYKITTKQEFEMLENVRRICSSLPEVKEVIDGFGHIIFQVNGKTFIRLGQEEGSGLSFKSDHANQEILLQQEQYFKTPYIGHHGWVSIKKPQHWDELSELLKEAYLRAAPKRLVKQLLS